MANVSSGIIDDITTKRAGKIKYDLDRMRSAYEILSNYCGQQEIPATPFSILVAGTNGKGSICGLLYLLLRSRGLLCGVYTSPHLTSFAERFYFDDKPADLNELENSLALFKDKILKTLWDELSFFEISTLLAYYSFRRNACQIAIYEVGLGGRLDSTNALDRDLSIVTSIGLDHCETLGDTYESIAREKYGIFRGNEYLIWLEGKSIRREKYPILAQELSVLASQKNDKSCQKVMLMDDNDLINSHFRQRSSQFNINWENAQKIFHFICHVFSSPRFNKKIAGLGADKPLKCHSLSSETDCLPPSLWARGQRLKVHSPQWGSAELFFDVAHNRESIGAMLQHLHELRARGIVIAQQAIICMLSDKPIADVVAAASEFFKGFSWFRIDYPRCFVNSQVEGLYDNMSIYDSFGESFLSVVKNNKYKNQVIPIFGSVIAMGEVFRYLQVYSDFSPNQFRLGK